MSKWASQNKTFLYLMSSGGRRPRLKVGITWNLALRARTLGWERGLKMRLVAYRPFPEQFYALTAETQFHQRAQGGKKRKEWYAFAPSIIHEFLRQDGVILCG